MSIEKFEVRNRWSGEVQFTAEIETAPDMTTRFKLGLAVKWARKSGANLSDADLSGADLRGASLSGANLSGAYLRDAKNIKLPHFQIPQEGELIVWKKLAGGQICKLRIPPEAKRTASVIGRKCRAEFVEVLEGEGTSWRAGRDALEYAPGEIVRPDKYDDSPLVECTSGIHFFLTREEAEEWA